ncbi:MAG: hypothetical protein ACLUKN_05180 [Bacilli bacterium]
MLTLDEVLGNAELEDVAHMHFKRMEKNQYNVMTIHSELEGMAYLDWFDEFLAQARAMGVEFFSLSVAWQKNFQTARLPACVRNQNDSL